MSSCPFCSSAELRLVVESLPYVECSRCMARGPLSWTEDAAWTAWHNRAVKETDDDETD